MVPTAPCYLAYRNIQYIYLDLLQDPAALNTDIVYRYCVPQSLCAPSYLDLLYDPAAPCYLAPNTPGVCCLPRKDTCK